MLRQRIPRGADALREEIGHHGFDRPVGPFQGTQVLDLEDEPPCLLRFSVAPVALPGKEPKAGDEVVAGPHPRANPLKQRLGQHQLRQRIECLGIARASEPPRSEAIT